MTDEAPTIEQICSSFQNDRTQMISIAREVQKFKGYISDNDLDEISQRIDAPRVELEAVVSFYSFFSRKPKGDIVIRLCNDVIDKMAGADEVAEALEKALGISCGETTADDRFTLEWTACIGMSDQAPAALVNDVVVTCLDKDKALKMVETLEKTNDPKSLVDKLGDGNNAHPLVRSMVENKIQKEGEVIFGKSEDGVALAKAIKMGSDAVIREVKNSKLRGRGGAGFSTGTKWQLTQEAPGKEKVIICNADEGEPGTFKDRMLLTEKADMMIEGMTIAGYAIGAKRGIIYLRAEYTYLLDFLNDLIEQRHQRGLLGSDICGKKGFHFSMEIIMGAGAYICGEETALISSCEDQRGDPKDRPPFPTNQGYRGLPTCVNNVETFCMASRILEKGADWFSDIGPPDSTGTKLLSISGDCRKPGIYELPLGVTINEVLAEAGAENTLAVQVGGPAGHMVNKDGFDSAISYSDVATGGSFMIFDETRDPLDIVRQFMEFFVDESCGYCTPCRVGNVLLKKKIEEIIEGKGMPSDLPYLEDLSETIIATSRCGLGHTSPNPILSTLKEFRSIYEEKVMKPRGKASLLPTFDLQSQLSDAEAAVGRKSIHSNHAI